MAAFAAGRLDILVATSVLEVGVDVPNASCLVVQQAERFGLASLHQLRGRVGRGPRQSYAFLVYGEDLSEAAAARLKAVLDSSDGFALAEEDLRLRGPGDFLGRGSPARCAWAWPIWPGTGRSAWRPGPTPWSWPAPIPGLARPENAPGAGGRWSCRQAGEGRREASEEAHADHGWIL